MKDYFNDDLYVEEESEYKRCVHCQNLIATWHPFCPHQNPITKEICMSYEFEESAELDYGYHFSKEEERYREFL